MEICSCWGLYFPLWEEIYLKSGQVKRAERNDRWSAGMSWHILVLALWNWVLGISTPPSILWPSLLVFIALETAGRNVNCYRHWNTVWRFLKKLKKDFPFESTIWAYTWKNEITTRRDSCTPMFSAALLTIFQMW